VGGFSRIISVILAAERSSHAQRRRSQVKTLQELRINQRHAAFPAILSVGPAARESSSMHLGTIRASRENAEKRCPSVSAPLYFSGPNIPLCNERSPPANSTKAGLDAPTQPAPFDRDNLGGMHVGK